MKSRKAIASSTTPVWLAVASGTVVASALLSPVSADAASATVTRFTFSSTETFADAPPECMPVVKSGVTTATDSGSGQVTETASGFAVHLHDLFVYRTDFADGSYLSGSAVGHIISVDTSTRQVANDVVQERRTI